MKRFGFLLVALLAAVMSVSQAMAATVIVTPPINSQDWSTADTRPGGEVSFVVDPTAPSGNGALQLTTDATTTAKAQYLHGANTPLADVTDLGDYTKQNAASFPGGAPSYQLIRAPWTEFPGETCTGFDYLRRRSLPYQNGVVVPATSGSSGMLMRVNSGRAEAMSVACAPWSPAAAVRRSTRLQV